MELAAQSNSLLQTTPGWPSSTAQAASSVQMEQPLTEKPDGQPPARRRWRSYAGAGDCLQVWQRGVTPLQGRTHRSLLLSKPL